MFEGAFINICILLTFQLNRKSYLASASWDKTIKLWDLSNCNCVTTLAGHSDCVWGLTSYKIDGNLYFASASDDKTIKIWSNVGRTNYKCLKTLVDAHNRDVVKSVQFSPNGQFFVSGWQ